MKIPPVRRFDNVLSKSTIFSCGLQLKFKKEELHRLPEFDEAKPEIASTSATSASNISTRPLHPNQHQANVMTPTRQTMQRDQTKPLSSIPAHVRSEISNLGSTSNVIQADVKGKGPARPTGLNTPITPHPPLQHPNIKPQQHQHQSDRRVSFSDHQQASTTKPASATATTMNPEPKQSPTDFDAEDSFGFNSDDDALFALADLGPPIDPDGADAGRPIDSDEGRPIGSNESLLGGSADDTMIGDDVFDQHQHQKKTEPSVVGVVSAPKLTRQEMIAAALMSVEETDTTSTSGLQGYGFGEERQASNPSDSNQTTSGTGAGTLLQVNACTNASSVSGLGLRSSVPPQRQQQQNQNQNPGLNLTSLVQQRHQRSMAQRQNQNENQKQMGLSSSGSRDESKRASTPMIGGFHFPPGITSSSGIGSKRPAEAMA